MTLETLAAFFGWMTLINFALFLVAVLFMWLFQGLGMRMHAKMFGIDQSALPVEWYRYLGNYKIAIIMLNLVPYLALLLMA